MSQRWLAVFLISCIAGSVAVAGSGAAQSSGPPAGRPAGAAPGMTSTPFSVPAGTIRVNLPDDMAAGDTISGTVIAEPAGRTDAERSANASVLQGYVVDAGLRKANGGMHRALATPLVVLTFSVPDTASTMQLILRDARGKAVGRVTLSAHAQQPRPGTSPQPQDFRFPEVVVAGQPLAIHGPFDGDLANTTLTIGGQPAEMLAESPRKLAVAPAPNVSGPSEYRLTENRLAVIAPCSVISLKLSAPKTSLMRGERVSVHIAIGGLAGIRTPVSVKLVNATPQVVTLAGGALQVLTVRPDDVAPGGTYATDRDVTGLGSGAFSIYAELDDRNPPAFVNGTPPLGHRE